MKLYRSDHSLYSTASRTPIRHENLAKLGVRLQELESACPNNISPLDKSRVSSLYGGELRGDTHRWLATTDRRSRYMCVVAHAKLQFEVAA